MRARAVDAARDAGAAFGLENGLVGIGESLDRPPDSVAQWLARPFGEDEVPPAVSATFARGGRNLQRMHDAAAERRTADLWEKWRGR
ncbi:MAG TPA: hypothetical protein VF032_16170 [Thermoleophilaceae bacterium]